MKKYRVLTDSSLFLLVVLFVYTAVNKLMRLSRFRFQLTSFPLIGRLSPWIAWAVILAELMVVVLLLWRGRPRAGFVASLILLSLFTAYLIGLVSTTPQLPCTCGGALENLSWPQHIAFNLVCIGIAVLGIVCERRLHRARQKNSFSIPQF